MTRTFVSLGPDSKQISFFRDDVHDISKIPKGAIEISDDQWQGLLKGEMIFDGAMVAPFDPSPTMAARRRSAFDAAMAYGNGITAKVTKTYADVEVQSWTAQEAEARTVLAGGTLIEHALLPPLAEDKGVSLEAYAESVIEKADAYRQIAVAAVRLRRGAEGLLSEQLDTPEKLDAAVEALRAQTLAAAEALGIEV